MRNHNTFSSSISQNNDNSPSCSVNGQKSINTLCNISTRNTLSDNKVYKFEFCSFIGVTSPNTDGGAILFVPTGGTSSSSLTVSNCLFSSCKANSGEPNLSGGGVSVRAVADVTVSSCLFMLCESSGSGGLFLQGITHQPSISECTFHSCRCPKTGAGAYVGYCALAVSPVFCRDCRFIKGEPLLNRGYSLSGGGLSLSSSSTNRANTIVNAIFANNQAVNGGGLHIYKPSGIIPSVKFCVFYGNTATNHGHDINLTPMEENPLFYCFTSNTQNNRLYVYPAYKSTPSSSPTNYPNWLRQGGMPFPIEISSDTDTESFYQSKYRYVDHII